MELVISSLITFLRVLSGSGFLRLSLYVTTVLLIYGA